MKRLAWLQGWRGAPAAGLARGTGCLAAGDLANTECTVVLLKQTKLLES